MVDPKTVISEVKKVEISTRNLVDGLMTGNYISVFRGKGIEFSEVRDYVPGDDINSIDWNVTARTGIPHVKEFIEERDLTVYVLFDISGSSRFGSQKSKKHKAIELAATLSFAALRNNDKIGLIMFSEGIEKVFKARKGRKHVLRLIREMLYFEPESDKTDLSAAIEYTSKILKRKAIIFIISDFFSSEFDKELKLLRNKHDVIAINLRDIREMELPKIGLIQLEDEETGEQLIVDTDDEDLMKHYHDQVLGQQDNLKKTLKRNKVDLIQIKTDEDFAIPLRAFFKKREGRR